jgi:hypothetical protein
MSTPIAKVAPRLRAAKDIDLTRAKPGCRHCNGTGTVGYRTVEMPDPEDANVKHLQRVKLVCRCVTRRGGVAEDMLDKMAREMSAALEDGSFARTLADDLRAMPEEARARAVVALSADVNNPDKTPAARAACAEVLRLLDAPAAVTTAEA